MSKRLKQFTLAIWDQGFILGGCCICKAKISTLTGENLFSHFFKISNLFFLQLVKAICGLALFSFLTTGYVLAGNVELNAQQWLDKMSHAMKTLHYQGTVAFSNSGRLDTMKYFHATDNSLEQERLLSLNSPMREVKREAGIVSCIFKDSKRIVVNHRPVSQSFIMDLPVDFAVSSNDYQFSLTKEESVAMLPTQVISIDPRDKYRYGRKIWVNKQHFLPLKVEVYDLSGKTLEQVVFTDLQVGSETKFVNVDNAEKNHTVEHIHKVKASAIDDAGFMVENIPSGFQTVFFTIMKADKTGHSVDHLLLSDGFSSVSVYREIKADDAKEGLQTLGVVNSFTRIIKNFQITVMGEVPAKTVRFIAEGIKLR